MIDFLYSLPLAQIAGWCSVVGVVMILIGVAHWIMLTYVGR